jgi:hypothetical protein
MKIIRFQVGRPQTEDAKEMFERWGELSVTVQRIKNRIIREWLVWHTQYESAVHIRKYLDERQKDKSIKNPVQCWPTDFAKHVYKVVCETYPIAYNRIYSQLLQEVRGTLTKRKSAKGSLPGWVSILFDYEAAPSFTRAQPIPFDKYHCEITPPDEQLNFYRLTVRLNAELGTTTKKKSVVDTVALVTRGMDGHQLATLKKLAEGTVKFCGSSLLWDQNKRKWFALIAWDQEAQPKPALDGSLHAVLYAARNRPWLLRLPDRTIRLQGDGRHIGAIRQQVLTQRWDRQANYRYAGSANKGHGRERALIPVEKLSERWKHFVQTVNHNVSRDVVNILTKHGIGSLTYVKPDKSKPTRFLSNAGKNPNRHDSSSWDYFQIKSFLEYKCKDVGIELKTVDK